MPVARQKGLPNGSSRAILNKEKRKTLLRNEKVRGSEGTLGEPVARYWMTGARRRASQPLLKCLKMNKERRNFSGDYIFREKKQNEETGVRCRRLEGDRMKRWEQTRGKTGEGKYLFRSFWTHQRFAPQEKLPLVWPEEKGEGSYDKKSCS